MQSYHECWLALRMNPCTIGDSFHVNLKVIYIEQNQHLPAHYPLDDHYDSAVDEPLLTELIFGFTLVTHCVKS
jgi:hypothetical protein